MRPTVTPLRRRTAALVSAGGTAGLIGLAAAGAAVASQGPVTPAPRQAQASIVAGGSGGGYTDLGGLVVPLLAVLGVLLVVVVAVALWLLLSHDGPPEPTDTVATREVITAHGVVTGEGVQPFSAVFRRWPLALHIAMIAATIAVANGGPQTLWTKLIIPASWFALGLGGLVAQRRRRQRLGGVRPARPQRAPATVAMVLAVAVALSWGTLAVAYGASLLLKRVLPQGTVLSYGAQFLSVVAVLGVGVVLSAYLARRLSQRP